MHPPLFREHPKCADAVQLLISCHEENKISKFFGACNDVKIQLDRCFKLEKEEKRQLNLVSRFRLLSPTYVIIHQSIFNSISYTFYHM